nr:SET domain-containing protein-lysine N-methyltransferase [Candidatus Sigynarchaeota archaeon]
MYPSRVAECPYGGLCLVAKEDLPAGVVVEKFVGPLIPADAVRDEEARHIILWDDKSVMRPYTDARYANHSCEPNSYVNGQMEIVTMLPIKNGEEITFSYNVVYGSENPGLWDHRWSFKCACGAPNCQGLVNQYVKPDGTPCIVVESRPVVMKESLEIVR